MIRLLRDNRSSKNSPISNKDNTIYQTFNGITGLANNAADTSSTADCEVVRNWIHDTQDDAIEVELAHCINTLVIDNTTERTRSMISMAPIWSGPEWVLFNSANNCIEGAFKLGDGSAVNGSVGYALASNNTCTCSSGSPSAINSVGLYQNKHFRNNVLIGCNNFAIRNLDKGDLTLYGVADTVGSYTNDFNYDVIDSMGTISQVAAWLKVSGVIRGYSLPSLRANSIGFKWETNGQQGGVTYADSSRAQLWMRSRSRTVNTGCRIPGVNTMPTRQRGAAPDVGRWEYPFKSIEEK
jgi:hypothetical protein